MQENTWGLMLWLWLLGGPLIGAFIELGRNGAPSRHRYDSPRSDMATTPVR